MNAFNIDTALQSLSQIRPIFHNEADFQFSFAWEIQKQNPDYGIRLEYKVPQFTSRYTDIWIKGENPIAIELKYKPVSMQLQHNKEIFELKKHGAQDIGRYDFLKDVQRLEEIIMKYPETSAYAIIITNDELYWKNPQKYNSVDKDFKIHQDRNIQGTLSWSSETGKGTMKAREEPIKINGSYNINWKNYSNFDQKYGQFKMLCLEIDLSFHTQAQS